MNELQQLATDVLEMFEKQREYFKTKNPEKLNECKAIESALKKRCKAIVEGRGPDLFSGAEKP
jgi:hypothetical protein